MKANKLLIAVLSIAMLGMVACNEKNAPTGPGQPNPNDSTAVISVDTTGTYVTIAQALDIISGLAPAGATDQKYKIVGEVIQNNTDPANVPGKYTNINITIKDATGSIACYYMNNLNNEAFTSSDQVPRVGSKVVMIGQLKNYLNKNTNATTPEMANGFILRIIEMKGEANPNEYTYVTIAQALEIGKTLAQGGETYGYYMDTVVITTIKTEAANVPGKYTNINMTVKDETGTMDSYYTNYLENAAFTSADQIPPVNSKIILIAKIANYQGTLEFKNGYIAKILEEGDGKIEPEVKGDVVFMPTAKKMPEGWTKLLDGEAKDASDNDFYADFAFKLDKLNKGVQSPEFEGSKTVNVSFVINKLNSKQNAAEETDGSVDVIGLDADGNPTATVVLEGVNAADTYTAELVSEDVDIVAVQVILRQFPWNGEAQCNAALKEVAIEINTEME